MGELIGHDPALTTRVLRLSNSAFFRVSRKIGNADEAVALLGLTHVRSLVMAAALGASFKNVPGIDLKQFWRYSLRSAEIARSLAGLLNQNQGNAFTAGLIHAIGILVMHIAMPDEMAPLDMGTPPLDLNRAEAEMAAFGYTYAEVGAGMAEKWQFPAGNGLRADQPERAFRRRGLRPAGGRAAPGVVAGPRPRSCRWTRRGWLPPFPTWWV